jgi:SAM-dependent methyltransferase
MSAIRQLFKRLPGFPFFYTALRNPYFRFKLINTSTEKIFTYKIRKRRKGGSESLSGSGSTLYQTRVIIRELPTLFQGLNVTRILDIPCGDFHWMNRVNLKGVDYIGADIVKELIQNNREKYQRQKVNFQYLNLISDKLPKVDLILCRDCLPHFCFEDIFHALINISYSEAKYLLTTTHPYVKDNHDIYTGQFRPLNLEIPPFNLSRPLRIINEKCTQNHGAFGDKSLGLWRIKERKGDVH